MVAFEVVSAIYIDDIGGFMLFNNLQSQLHQRALICIKNYAWSEKELIDALTQID